MDINNILPKSIIVKAPICSQYIIPLPMVPQPALMASDELPKKPHPQVVAVYEHYHGVTASQRYMYRLVGVRII